MTRHLTNEQLCDLLLDCSPHSLSTDSIFLHQHLADCTACATELASLRDSIALFRSTSISLASTQCTSIRATNLLRNPAPQPSSNVVPRSVYWAAVAAVLVAVAAIPPNLANLHRQRTAPARVSNAAVSPSPSQQADEALLEEISQEIAEPIPSPMRPLADPTATTLKVQANPAKRNN